MVDTKISARVIEDQPGAKNVAVLFRPVDSAVSVEVLLNAKSARGLAALMSKMADEAEQVIVMPAFDSVSPTSA